MSAEFSGQFEAIFPRQPDVEKDYIDIIALKVAPHLRPIVGDQHRISFGSEIALEASAGDRVIIDHEKLYGVFQNAQNLE